MLKRSHQRTLDGLLHERQMARADGACERRNICAD
jgi:hypothetical protein